jgi:hypothetical protein
LFAWIWFDCWLLAVGFWPITKSVRRNFEWGKIGHFVGFFSLFFKSNHPLPCAIKTDFAKQNLFCAAFVMAAGHDKRDLCPDKFL